jgi:VanZ family protein
MPRPFARPTTSRLVPASLAVYLVTLVWGSLFPMRGWEHRGTPLLAFLLDPWPRYWTGFDLAFNVAIYLPGGLLVAMLLRASGLRTAAAPLALLGCSALAIGLEALQTLLPGRVPSRLDWLANTAGALLGALAAPLGERAVASCQRALEARRAISGTDSATGSLLLAGWLAIQWPAYRPLFGQGDLQLPMAALASAAWPAAASRLAPAHAEFLEALGVTCAVVGTGLIVRELLPTRAPRALLTAVLVACAILVQSAGSAALGTPRVAGWLSAGAQGGLVGGALLLALLAVARRRTRLHLAIAAFAAGITCSTLFPLDAYHASAASAGAAGGWRNLEGLLRAAAVLWPFAAILWCVRRLRALEPQPPADPLAPGPPPGAPGEPPRL